MKKKILDDICQKLLYDEYFKRFLINFIFLIKLTYICSQILQTMTKSRVTFLALLVLGILSLQAQPGEELQYYLQKYPGENVVQVSQKQTVTIKLKHGKPATTIETYSEKIILADFASSYAQERVPYTPGHYELTAIEAYSLIPDGNSYKKVPVKKFSHSVDLSTDVFYDDGKQCNFVFPEVVKGTKIIYKARFELNSFYFLPRLFFAKSISVEKSEIEINYDSRIDLAFNEVAILPGQLHRPVENDGKTTTLKMWMNDIPKLIPEKNVTTYLAYRPHFVLRIDQYKQKSNGKPIPVLPNLDYLNKYYRSLACNVNKEDQTKIKLFVDSLVKDTPTEFDKVKKIYNWVQQNIKYIAFTDGNKGVVPMDAAQVFQKRYGDCKAMSNLVCSMLQKAGITSYLTFVGTDDLPYKFSEIPADISNHLVVCYFDKNDTPYILDATAEFQSIAFATNFIQGKECLVSIDSNNYKIIEIPYKAVETTEKTEVEFSGTALQAKTKLALMGSEKSKYAYLFASKTDAEKRKILSTELAEDGQPKSNVSFFTHSNIYNVDDTLSLWYNYTIENYVLKTKDELYVNPYLHHLEVTYIDVAKREYAFEMEHKQKLAWDLTIAIPKGYEIASLPPDIAFSHPLFSFHAAMSQEGNKIILKADYLTDFIVLDKKEYEKWNEMNALIRQFKTGSMVFKKAQ